MDRICSFWAQNFTRNTHLMRYSHKTAAASAARRSRTVSAPCRLASSNTPATFRPDGTHRDRRGPVIVGGPDGGALSLRFPARVEGRLGFEALLPLLRSRSVAEVETALQDWVEPVNSVLAADAAGNVRHALAGLGPERSHHNRRIPVPAYAPEHSWKGIYVPLPRTAVTRFAVSANDRAAGGGEATGMEFARPPRRRFRELLEDPGITAFSVDHMQAIHTDTRLGPWTRLRGLVDTLDAGALSASAAGLRSRLLSWDGRMDAGSKVPPASRHGVACWSSGLPGTLRWHRSRHRPDTRRCSVRGCRWLRGWDSPLRRCCSAELNLASAPPSRPRRRWKRQRRWTGRHPVRATGPGAGATSCWPSTNSRAAWPASRTQASADLRHGMSGICRTGSRAGGLSRSSLLKTLTWSTGGSPSLGPGSGA